MAQRRSGSASQKESTSAPHSPPAKRPSKRKVAEKKRAEKEAEKKMKHEEAKAANFLKILENCSPGAVLHVGCQVIFLFISMLFVLLFPDLMRCRSRKLR